MATLMCLDSYSKNTSFVKDLHQMLIKERMLVYQNILESRLKASSKSVAIADYGTHDGENFLLLLENLIDHTKLLKFKGNLKIIFHDQKDFDTEKLDFNLQELEKRQKQISTLVTLGDVYQRCLEDNSIDIAFCTMVVHWMAGPIPITNGILFIKCTEEERKHLKVRACNEWTSFLKCRSEELKPCGYLVVRHPTNVTELMQVMSGAFDQIYSLGVITKEEYKVINVQWYIRDVNELREPLDKSKKEVPLKLLDLHTFQVTLFKPEQDTKEDLIRTCKPWMYNTLKDYLSKSRNDEETENICQTYFELLSDKIKKSNCASFEMEMTELIMQKI